MLLWWPNSASCSNCINDSFDSISSFRSNLQIYSWERSHSLADSFFLCWPNLDHFIVKVGWGKKKRSEVPPTHDSMGLIWWLIRAEAWHGWLNPLPDVFTLSYFYNREWRSWSLSESPLEQGEAFWQHSGQPLWSISGILLRRVWGRAFCFLTKEIRRGQKLLALLLALFFFLSWTWLQCLDLKQSSWDFETINQCTKNGSTEL